MRAERDDVIDDIATAPATRAPGGGAGVRALESINSGMAAGNSCFTVYARSGKNGHYNNPRDHHGIVDTAPIE